MKTNKISGMYWHCHHDILCEYVWDNQERIGYIIKNKPKNEIETRLKLFKKVKGKLPVEFVKAWKKLAKAWKKYDEAWKKRDEAGKKYDEAWKKRDEVWKNYDEARKKYDEAWHKLNEAWKKRDEVRERYALKIEALHKKECGCSEWNGRRIVFKEKNK